MKKIKLTQNKYALVDDEDFEWLNQWKWHTNGAKEKHVTRRVGNKKIWMHRLIMNCPLNMQIDHIDRNPLNNRRGNLRIVTHSQNMINRSGWAKYKGVSLWIDDRNGWKKWRARIQLNKKSIFLGYFNSKEKAISEYKKAQIKFHKEYASTT